MEEFELLILWMMWEPLKASVQENNVVEGSFLEDKFSNNVQGGLE